MQAVQPDPTQISLFLFASGLVVMGIALTIAGWKHKALIWGLILIAAAFFVLTFTWQKLPAIGSALNAIVGAGALSFLAVIVGLAAIVVVHVKTKRLQISRPAPEPAASERTEAVKLNRLDEIAASVQEIQEFQRGFERLRKISRVLREFPARLAPLDTQWQLVEERASQAHADHDVPNRQNWLRPTAIFHTTADTIVRWIGAALDIQVKLPTVAESNNSNQRVPGEENVAGSPRKIMEYRHARFVHDALIARAREIRSNLEAEKMRLEDVHVI